MKKPLLLMILLMIPIVYGVLEQCENPTTANEIPCNMVSTWDYDDCATTTVKIFNATPTLLATRTFTDYGLTGKCNFTWNITDKGSYIWNATNWDTGRIIVEADETMNLAITFGLSLFAILFIGGGVWMFTRRKE